MPEKKRPGKRRGRNHLFPWTVKERRFLEEHYGQRTAQDTGDTLWRSAGVVRSVARSLGLSVPRVPAWTEEELALLRMNYGRGIAFVQTLLPGRTENAIRIRAGLMGGTHHAWTTEERRYLEKYHGSIPIPAIAAALGWSIGGVDGMFSELGQGKRPKTTSEPWTEQELEILRTHYGTGAWISRVHGRALSGNTHMEGVTRISLDNPRGWFAGTAGFTLMWLSPAEMVPCNRMMLLRSTDNEY
ncbi:TPA: hypothetical protein I8Y21_006001 [Klebsiella oxytoca]|uniref:Uncharacterized protein n=1 Tax=Klebsiella oxytoca TaxID=571 RepID=A0AAN5LFI6_KLEOX|nr:hypothetical protein [Klebsiella oxytoca]